MPELPDISAYIATLEPRIVGQPLERARLASVFLLRTADPPLTDVEGRTVRALRRIGKRIAIGVEGDLWPLFTQHIYERRSFSLFAINAGYWLLAMVLAAGVLAVWR